MMEDDYQKINDALLSELQADPFYREQLDKIMIDGSGDIDGSFLGFVAQYYHLSQIIPLDRTIYDLGCGYGPQSWYFRNHHKYVAVDLGESVIMPPNGEFYHMSIGDFVKTQKIDKIHFAICSYVPPWGGNNEELVRENFEHLFIYYPRSRPKGEV